MQKIGNKGILYAVPGYPAQYESKKNFSPFLDNIGLLFPLYEIKKTRTLSVTGLRVLK